MFIKNGHIKGLWGDLSLPPSPPPPPPPPPPTPPPPPPHPPLSPPSLPPSLSIYMYIIYIVNVLMIVYVYITYCSMILIRSDDAHIYRLKWFFGLTHWGRVTHLCVSKLATIGSDNGLSPGRRQTIIWTNAGILLIGPLGTNLSEILSEIHTFSLKKMHLKMSGKWRPFCSASIHTWTCCLVN